MNNNNNNKAFSLIELSIVLIIIGLLVAGITGGQSLIESAKIRSLFNEFYSYKQSYYSFIALTGRLPGDANNDGKIGFFQSDNYIKYFPAPYDGSDSKYGLPNTLSGPFVDLYLAKIIDFKPQNTSIKDRHQLALKGGLPVSKILKDAKYYYESKKDNDITNIVFKKDLKNSNYITLESIKYEKNKKWFNIKPIFLKKIDEKIDDGIHNRGLAIASCTLNYGEGDDSASYDLAKSCKALLFSLE